MNSSPVENNRDDNTAASNLPSYDVTELVSFEEQPDGSLTVESRDCGVSPCFVNCGEPACQKLGCVRVYNARHAND